MLALASTCGIERVAIPALRRARKNEVIVIDEIGTTAESEAYVAAGGKGSDKPTLLTLHKKAAIHSGDICLRRRPHLEVTPVNRALLLYKIAADVRPTERTTFKTVRPVIGSQPPALMAQRLFTGGAPTVLLACACLHRRTTLDISLQEPDVLAASRHDRWLVWPPPALTNRILFSPDGEEAMAGRRKQEMLNRKARTEQSARARLSRCVASSPDEEAHRDGAFLNRGD